LEEVESGGKRKRKVGGKKSKDGMEKRFKSRSLASILIEESGRSDGIVKEYLEAEARPTSQNKVVYPKRKFFPVTGLLGFIPIQRVGFRC